MEDFQPKPSERTKKRLRRVGGSLAEGQVFRLAEIRKVISKAEVPLSSNKAIKFLLKEELLKLAALDFPSRKETRYLSRSVHPFSVAMSVGRNAYLSHFTAMYLHGLTDLEPVSIYINSEQGPKYQAEIELSQESIDAAFRHQPRHTKNHADFAGRTIFLLNGKFTGRLGVTEKLWNKLRLEVTDLERTLIDIAVRPQYSGGTAGVILAYKRAGKRVSIERIVRYLDLLEFAYPYHQAIGFYLDEAAEFPEQSLTPLLEKPKQFDFYLAHGATEMGYSQRWRIFYPKTAVKYP